MSCPGPSLRPSLRVALWRRRGARAGIFIMGALLGTTLLADFVASDKAIVAMIDGELYLLPNLFDPPGLRAHSLQSLSTEMGEEDWLWEPLIPWGVNEQDKGQMPLAPPSARHWLGTDTSRRDVLARVIHGTRVAVVVGLFSMAIYVIIGTLMGLLAGFLGGWVDVVVCRVIETMMSIPVFFLILALMGVLESAGIGTLVWVIGLVYWTHVARLVRAEALRLRRATFIEAGMALGFSARRIMLRHMLPNALGPILVSATFGVATSILIEASLSFLGFGVPDSTASWGGLLRGAMGNFHAWWLVVFPGCAIFATVIACNLVGEALRDTLDTRQ